ncbi:ATP-binding protein [Colwelliaceae bacterium 6471]
MKNKFHSLRQKLVLKLGVTYLAALVFVFTLIIVKNTLDFNATIAETQSRLSSSLNNKGMLLIKNNSTALVGLVEDNAFSAVKQIISNTVQSSSDIVYGIFTDIEKNNWVYAFDTAEIERFKPIIDRNEEWAFAQSTANASNLYFEDLLIVEFSAPVTIDDELLGVIRYGLSTESLIATIELADQQATSSLLQTLIVLIAVGLITIYIVYWRTDKVAEKITVPLNLLTEAANIVANGNFEHRINIKTNDEIGILASNFNTMTNIINHTIGDLAKISQIGNYLTKARDAQNAFEWILMGLTAQLPFQIGLIFHHKKNLKLIASYSDKNLAVDNLVHYISVHEDVKNYLVETPGSADILSADIDDENVNMLFKSFALIPFGTLDNSPIYVCLISKKSQQILEASELEFCFSVRHLLSTSLQNIAMNELLEEQNKNLENTVDLRTQELHKQNEALSSTLVELEQAQSQLIESEKMASLGNLVAGISHEVNTPIGVSVTAASHLHKETKTFGVKFNNGELTKSGFIEYMNLADETSEIILSNLERASTLIQSFKQIAVDQTSDTRSTFKLKEHLDMLIVSLRPTYKILPITINLTGDEVEIECYPGLLNQVITNLIINSIKHGLENCTQGEISVSIEHEEEQITVTVADNGVGISDDIKSKVFDPFFTTQRGSGGSGLGLNIVYNIVTQKLHGEIRIEDNIPSGVKFVVSLPKEFPPEAS